MFSSSWSMARVHFLKSGNGVQRWLGEQEWVPYQHQDLNKNPDMTVLCGRHRGMVEACDRP